jgi:hypothetical protein
MHRVREEGRRAERWSSEQGGGGEERKRRSAFPRIGSSEGAWAGARLRARPASAKQNSSKSLRGSFQGHSDRALSNQQIARDQECWLSSRLRASTRAPFEPSRKPAFHLFPSSRSKI